MTQTSQLESPKPSEQDSAPSASWGTYLQNGFKTNSKGQLAIQILSLGVGTLLGYKLIRNHSMLTGFPLLTLTATGTAIGFFSPDKIATMLESLKSKIIGSSTSPELSNQAASPTTL